MNGIQLEWRGGEGRMDFGISWVNLFRNRNYIFAGSNTYMFSTILQQQ